MYFESTPSDFTPIKDGLIFEFCCEESSDVEAVIVNDLTKAEVARLQIKNVNYGTIDIAPYIPTPSLLLPNTTGRSRIYNIGISKYRVELYRSGDSTPQCSSRAVTVSSNGYFSEEMPFLTTTMGEHRIISKGEYDNIGIYSNPGCAISANITSDAGDDITVSINSSTGVAHLIFAAGDLSANATSAKVEIYCDEEWLNEISYIIQPRHTIGVRLAWRTAKGNIEQYTFPVVSQNSITVRRNQTTTKYNTEQILDSQMVKQQHLISDFEPRSTLDALSEIIAAPEVWMVYPNHSRISVVNSALQYDITHTIGRIEMDIVSARKEGCI